MGNTPLQLFHKLINVLIVGERILEMLLSQIVDGVRTYFEQESSDSTIPILASSFEHWSKSSGIQLFENFVMVSA